MANIVLFHSVLGLRPAVKTAAEKLRKAGHTVFTPDLYSGMVFDDMEAADAKFQEIGISEMMSRTRLSVGALPEDLVYAGFSNGGASAELLAATRKGAKGCILFHAALPLQALGLNSWSPEVPVQIHYATEDPRRNDNWLNAFSDSVRQAGAKLEFYEYHCQGHLFTDPGLQDYSHDAAELSWWRVLEFLKGI